LVIETETAFPLDGLRLFGLREAVRNFFRRTGYYYRVYYGESISLSEALDTFASAFGTKWLVRKRYLAPLAAVQFCVESIKFRGFEIRSFSSADLDRLLGNSVNEVFYPWAKVDLSKLQPYWFIDVYDQSMTSVEPEYEIPFDARPSVRKEFTEFPKAIEMALRPVALYDWEPVHKWASFQSVSNPASEPGFGWFHFRIPFWLEVNDNPLIPPPSAPVIPDVEMEIVGLDEDDHEIEIPFRAVDMDIDSEAKFGDFVSWAEECLTRLEPLQEKWPFVEIATGFLLKAFFSDGLEQLLWHITVLESLFGENKEGNTSLLADRLGRALEGDRAKKDIKKAFRALYNFRSEMVHGKEGLLEQTIYVGHLREARQFARAASLWFLRYLEHVQSHCGDDHDVFPEREELLAVLDFDGSGRKHIIQLIDVLPDNFPRSFNQ
jgi:hypothetical protein